MAEQEKLTFPSIPLKQWWILRSKFKRSIPTSVTAGYLATALDMQPDSARANVLPSLIAFKIIDQEGKPTDRANQWRDDEQYPAVCEQIRMEIYPQELLEALPPPAPNRDAAERWFANRTGVGEVAARRMALVYILLCEANPAGGEGSASQTSTKASSKVQKRTPPKQPQSKAVESASKTVGQPAPVHKHQEVVSSSSIPSLHIDVQIHISPDASSDQIDHIFASMAKHLGKLMRRDDERVS